MINSVVLMGRLTADPELRTTANGTNYSRFSVAVERPFKNGDEKITDFINCVAWRQTAEFVTRYFTKGQMIAVEGSIQTGSYTNKDGAKVYTTDVLVNSVSFTGSKVSSETSSQAAEAPAETLAEEQPAVGPEIRPEIMTQRKRRRRLIVGDLFADPEEELYQYERPQQLIDKDKAYRQPVYPRNWKKDEGETE